MNLSINTMYKKKSLSVFVMAIAYLLLVIVLMIYGNKNLNDDFWEAIYFHPLLFSLTIGFVIYDYNKYGHWFNISNFMLVLIYIYMGLGSLNYIVFFDEQTREGLRHSESAALTFWLVCLTAIVFRMSSKSRVCSYLARVLPVRTDSPSPSNRLRLGIALALGISVIIKLYLIASGQFGFSGDYVTEANEGNSFQGILTTLDQLSYVAVMIGMYYWFSGFPLARLDKLCLAIIVMILIAFALMYGMKAKVLQVILIIIIPAILVGFKNSRRIIPYKVYAIVGIFFVSFWLVNPLIRAVMVTTHSDNVVEAISNTGISIVDGISAFSNAAGNDGLSIKKIDVIWGRMNLFETFNSVVAQIGHGSNEYQYWKNYPYLPVTFIPRVILPNKPRNDQSTQFNLDYITDVPNSSTPSTIGWSYMQSGISSMVILMGVLGLVYGTIDVYCFQRSRLSVFGVVIFGTFFVKMANLEPAPYWVLGGIPHILVLLLFSYILFILKVRFGKRG